MTEAIYNNEEMELQPPPQQPQQTQQQKKKHGCFYYGCLTMILLAVIVGVLCGGAYLYGRKNITPYVDRYMRAIDEENYKGAFAMVGPQWKQIWDFDQFSSFAKKIRTALGKCTDTDKSLLSFNIIKNAGQPTMAVAVYEVQFEKGPATVTFTMAKEDDQWLVEGVNYESDLLLELLKCKHCGKMNKTLGDFCAYCGKPMSGE